MKKYTVTLFARHIQTAEVVIEASSEDEAKAMVEEQIESDSSTFNWDSKIYEEYVDGVEEKA